MDEWAAFTVNGFTITGLSAFVMNVILLYVMYRGLGSIAKDLYDFLRPSQAKNRN